jgi:hypothetical protein
MSRALEAIIDRVVRDLPKRRTNSQPDAPTETNPLPKRAPAHAPRRQPKPSDSWFF